jgi:hypothetical protein
MALYVYGVVSASAAVPDCPGIGGAELRLIADDGLAALVSPAPAEELAMGREALDAHARVLQEAHALDTVLPMRFGMLMGGDEEVVQRLLSPLRDELREQLGSLAGTVELKLRASYEEDSVLREIVRENEEIARLRDQLRDASPEATYYGQIRLGELVAQTLERKRERDAAEILGALQPLALALDASPPPSERIVFVASFLVARAQIDAFDAAVNQVGQAQAGRMRFTYTGPLPPHSFVNLAQAV